MQCAIGTTNSERNVTHGTHGPSPAHSHSLPECHLGISGGESLCLSLPLQTLPQTAHKWNKCSEQVTMYVHHTRLQYSLSLTTSSLFTLPGYLVEQVVLKCLLFNLLLQSSPSARGRDTVHHTQLHSRILLRSH